MCWSSLDTFFTKQLGSHGYSKWPIRMPIQNHAALFLKAKFGKNIYIEPSHFISDDPFVCSLSFYFISIPV